MMAVHYIRLIKGHREHVLAFRLFGRYLVITWVVTT